MRKGFTLIELLVVVGIMLTLMGIVFKLADIEEDSRARYNTIQRLQRLENCLGGYYAAFGCYPPVALYGSRDYHLRANNGIQSDDDRISDSELWDWDSIDKDSKKPDKGENKAWECVQAACRSQPIRCAYPFPEYHETKFGYWDEKVKRKFEDLAKKVNKKKEKYSSETVKKYSAPTDIGDPNRFTKEQKDEMSDWGNVQVFQFGVMSFLVPRYLTMLSANPEYYTFKQWTDNNPVPCHPLTGKRNYGKGLKATTQSAWESMCEDCGTYDSVWRGGGVKEEKDRLEAFTKLANIPSQAVCARWMPNLEGICTCNRSHKFFGVDIRKSDDEIWDNIHVSELHSANAKRGKTTETGGQYALDGITVEDGWGEELYYYSPSPHQSYTLWSSGPNRRTFPPWVSRSTLTEDANKCVSLWIEDDIISMSN